ncbi:hypothetical protein ES708_19796 [subsurface metagenome]
MVVDCTYCGELIKGEVVAPGGESELVYFDGDIEVVLEPEREIGFCSNRCAWRYGLDRHKAWGMPGKAARRHLIEDHGLTPPGKAPEDGVGV